MRNKSPVPTSPLNIEALPRLVVFKCMLFMFLVSRNSPSIGVGLNAERFVGATYRTIDGGFDVGSLSELDVGLQVDLKFFLENELI